MPGGFKKAGQSRRVECVPMNRSVEAIQPERQPAALEAGVPRHKYALAGIELSGTNVIAESGSLQIFPGRRARGPKFFQVILVAQGIHGPPKAVMFKCHQLTLSGQ